MIGPIRPDRLVKVLTTLARFGRSPAAGTISLAARYPDETMIVDELGTLTFGEVHRRTNALAHALSDAGIKEGDGVGIMCRNHRGFIESTVAVSKLGGDALYLNTAFSGPQLAEVAKREKPAAIIYDEEFAGLLARRAAGASASWPGTTRRHRRPDARRADRDGRPRDVVARRARAAWSSSPRAPRARRRARRAAIRRRSTRPCRSSRGSRCGPVRPCTWPRRCSTRGASRTTRSA